MPVFITLTNVNISDPSFWAGLNIDAESTIDASAVSDEIEITMSGNSIEFTLQPQGVVVGSFTDSDIAGGSFSQIVEFKGNDGDSTVSGSVGLDSSGYTGGSGDDTFTDDGADGGGLNGGGGDDILIGGVGNNNISGGDGNDILRGGDGNNNLYGNDGNDTLYADNGSGTLLGGMGDDVVYAGLNTTFASGGVGNDTLYIPLGSTSAPFSPGGTNGTVTLPNGDRFVYLEFQNVEIACFTRGTPIRTPNGEVAIEDLLVGDLVTTQDHGSQPIRWIGRRTVAGLGEFAPVCFKLGTIGNRETLRLSPQHRVLVKDWRSEMLFGESEVLCAAKHLCDGDRVYSEPCEEVTYFHIMFDRHEIVYSGDATLESFLVGEHVTERNQSTYDELLTLFPELNDLTHAARQIAYPQIKNYEVALLR